MESERAILTKGISQLGGDIKRLRSDANHLGNDLDEFRERHEDGEPGLRPYVLPCARHARAHKSTRYKRRYDSDQVKSVLVMNRHLKSKYAREAYFRADLAFQKSYFQLVLKGKQRRCVSFRTA